MKRIICTRPDGGVSIICPAPEIMRVMTLGGGFLSPGKRDIQIASKVAQGRPEWAAVRLVDALIGGGLTDAEAYEVIRDHDADSTWTGKELWDLDDIPSDRFFRDAWRRSHNGGPIYIHMPIARKMQIRRIMQADAARHAAKRRMSEEARLLAQLASVNSPEALKALL